MPTTIMPPYTSTSVHQTTANLIDEEFDWLLNVDVGATLKQLRQILMECSTRFHMPTPNHNCIVKPSQYNLFCCNQNQLDSIKIKTTLDGSKIPEADISIKLASKHPVLTIKTRINECQDHPFPWRLYQIQDAANHLSRAIDLITNAPLRMTEDKKYDFKSADEVLHLIDEIMYCLQKSRTSLLIPKRRTIEELQCSQNMQSIKPSLPIDFAISFYIQAHNLMCSIYHLVQTNNGPQIKAEYQAEVSVPFLSEVLVFLSLGLQSCQQMKDKVKTFDHKF